MRKKLIIGFLLLITIGVFSAWKLIYSTNFKSNIPVDLVLKDAMSVHEIIDTLNGIGEVGNKQTLLYLAKIMNFKGTKNAAKFSLDSKMSNRDLLLEMRSGGSRTANVVILGGEDIDELCTRLGNKLIYDKNDFLEAFFDSSFLLEFNMSTESLPAYIIPNTYNIYLSTTPSSFIKRMLKEHKKFWTKKRIAQAEKINLKPTEVNTLASIVLKEQRFKKEWPVIAGLYLNRLRIGMMLQSDPTVKYSLKNDTLKRIYFKHIQEAESPYNTYKYGGLPPGPICIVGPGPIDAVLNSTKSNYIYMCAREDFSGYHNFTNSHAQHMVNARKFRAAQNRRR